jgi:DNA-binding MarR family transcriptional regulator
MKVLVREAVSAQPILYPPEVTDPDIAELGLVDATIRIRRARAAHFPPEWFSDPAWDILLFLFISHLQEVKVTVGDVGHGTGNRPTTAIRWLDIIESAGLLDRRRSTRDSRRVYVFLNERGVNLMRKYFEAIRPNSEPQV